MSSSPTAGFFPGENEFSNLDYRQAILQLNLKHCNKGTDTADIRKGVIKTLQR